MGQSSGSEKSRHLDKEDEESIVARSEGVLSKLGKFTDHPVLLFPHLQKGENSVTAFYNN